jgi:hypothetical protein
MSLPETIKALSIDSIVVIDPAGDLVLKVTDKAYPLPASFRVCSNQLKSTSPYFEVLFDETKFSEGKRLATEWKALRDRYEDGSKLEDAPNSELPVLETQNIGRIGKVKNFQGLLTDFLRVCHGLDPMTGSRMIPPMNLANLAIVADRFNATNALRAQLKRRNLLFIGKSASGERSKRKSSIKDTMESGQFAPTDWTIANSDSALDWNEERCRIKVLAGLFLDQPSWVRETGNLIARGSQSWMPDSEPVDPSTSPLWWDLPMGVEG